MKRITKILSNTDVDNVKKNYLLFVIKDNYQNVIIPAPGKSTSGSSQPILAPSDRQKKRYCNVPLPFLFDLSNQVTEISDLT